MMDSQHAVSGLFQKSVREVFYDSEDQRSGGAGGKADVAVRTSLGPRHLEFDTSLKGFVRDAALLHVLCMLQCRHV